MDVGDFFLLANYHHVMPGGKVNIDEIIQEHLQKVVYPSNTISTRGIFRRESDNERSTPVSQFHHKRTDAKNVCKVFPSQQKAAFSTPHEQPHLSQTIGNTNESMDSQTIMQSNSSDKRQHEITNSGEIFKSLKLETNDKVVEKSTRCVNVSPTPRYRVDSNCEHIELSSQAQIMQRKSQGDKSSTCDSNASTTDFYKLQGCDKIDSFSTLNKEQQHVPKVKDRTLNVCESAEIVHTEQEVQRMEAIINTLVKAQKGYREMPTDKQTSSQLQESGALEKYKQIVGEKSIDSTSEGLQTLETILHLMQHRIKQIVKFSKSIPGFSELSVHDRLTLMKASKSESQMLGSVVVDPRTRSFQISAEKRLSFEEIQQLFPKDFLEQVFLISNKLDALNLSEREMAILRAMIITFPEREGLEDQHAVQRVHHQMRDCLLYVIVKNQHHNITLRLCQINNVLKIMRESTLAYNHVVVSAFEKESLKKKPETLASFFEDREWALDYVSESKVEGEKSKVAEVSDENEGSGVKELVEKSSQENEVSDEDEGSDAKDLGEKPSQGNEVSDEDKMRVKVVGIGLTF